MRKWLLLTLSLTVGCEDPTTVDKDVVQDTADTGDTGTTDTDTDTDVVTNDPDDDGDGFRQSTDCDDGDASINPDADELCDGIDNDCDNNIDDDAAATISGFNFATLDDAFAGATAGERIDVCPGTWTAPAIEIADSLTVFGVAGSAATTLTETNATTLFTVSSSGLLTLEGITITGVDDDGGVILVQDSSTLVMRDSAVTDNGSSAVVINGDSATILLERVTLSDNDAGSDEGGGVRALGDFDLTVTDSVISGNNAQLGGGLYAEVVFGVGTLALPGTLITGNTADTGGGLMALNLPITGSATTVIDANTATTMGGGVALVRASLDTLTVSGNMAPMGGGVAVVNDPLFELAPLDNELTDVQVVGNTSDQGAGLLIDNREELLVQLSGTTGAVASVKGNTASSTGGGAFVNSQAGLESIGVDWGADGASDDNSPDDVATPTQTYPVMGTDFVCSGGLGCI